MSSLPISFTVRNVNRTAVPCAADGKTYTVRGHLVGPAQASRSMVTLYLHGLSFGEFFWRSAGVRDYDYAAAQARRGLTSVVIDRLGYGKSDKPNGFGICAGSRADVAHQMVVALRSGHYRLGDQRSRKFRHVVLAGHSYGGQIAELVAHTFGGIDGLIIISYTDRGQSALLRANGAYAQSVCAKGGVPATGGGANGYAPFGPSSGAVKALFNNAAPKVVTRTLPNLTVDPCGDSASFPAATTVNLRRVRKIHVPVLLISGSADALFPPPGLAKQASLFTGTDRLDVVTVPTSGHAITLERTHRWFERSVAYWLGSLRHQS